MKHTLTIFFLILAFITSCCGTKETTTATTAANPLKGSYNVTTVTNTNLGMITPTIVMNTSEQKISGYAGCNRYTADYSNDAKAMAITNIASTKGACIQGMEQEIKFMEALEKVNRHTLENGKLTLYQDDTILIRAESKDM